MGLNSNCKNCKQSVLGKPDNSSDYCDSCKYDPNTGWGGYTDHSSTDDYGRPEKMRKKDNRDSTWSFT
jgi:hypothetical protein